MATPVTQQSSPANDPPQRQRWVRLVPIIVLLAATTVFYCINLTASGWGNSFYTAAVQAGAQDWTAFFYGSLDPENAITVDKTPAALWLMALSARLFGLSSASILLPEVLLGVASVYVVYRSVKSLFGIAAGIIAGVVLALTPVAVLMFRFNNPDALLVFLCTAAAALTLRAIRRPSAWTMAGVGALIGFAFLAKMLQAFMVIPALGLAYLVFAPTTWRAKITHSLAAVGGLVVAGGWWVAIVELVPAHLRPYIGGSETNSIVELALGYNASSRLSGGENMPGGGAFGGSEASLWRMFAFDNGPQVAWLLPAALIFLAVGAWWTWRPTQMAENRLTAAGYAVWGGVLLTHVAVFSAMQGLYHQYYTVALAPAIGAVVGMGCGDAWRRRDTVTGRVVLSLTGLGTAVWALFMLHRAEWLVEIGWLVLTVTIAAVAAMLVLLRWRPTWAAMPAAAVLVAALVAPAAMSVATVATPHTGSIVMAGPAELETTRPGSGPPGMGDGPDGAGDGTSDGQPDARGMDGDGGPGGPREATVSQELMAALQEADQAATWPLATISATSAANYQLAADVAVMAIGGFTGSDPYPTLEQFQEMVENGEVRYFAVGRGGPGGGPPGMSGDDGPGGGGSRTSNAISEWVQENFTEVTFGDSTVFDLTQPKAE